MAGLSGSGKSRAVENCVKDKNTVILNAYPEDFASVKNARRIIGTDNILKFLNGILENPYKREEKTNDFYHSDYSVICRNAAWSIGKNIAFNAVLPFF